MANPYANAYNNQYQAGQPAQGSQPNYMGLGIGTGGNSGTWRDVGLNMYNQARQSAQAANKPATTTGTPLGNVQNSVNAARNSVKPPPAFGTESGPGILESWFNQRATGTDPAF